MFDRLKQLNELRRKQGELQRDLEQELIEVEAGGGLVTIELNGAQKITNVRISEFPDSTETMGRLIQEAVNKGIAEAQKVAAEKGKHLFKDLGLPGL